MNHVAQIEPQGPVSLVPAPVSDTAAVIGVLERLARDPAVPMDRIERLMQVRKDIQNEAAEEAFNEAMSAVQSKMHAVAADANNSQTKSEYASYHALDKAIRPIYSAEGLALSFDTEDSPKPEHVRVVCYVTKGRYTRKYKADMPADGKGAKGGDVMTKTHAAGSAFTYGQRYLLKMIFNVAIGEDDDGNAADAGKPRITQEQADNLRDMLEASGKNRVQFLKWAKVDRIEDIAADLYQACADAINYRAEK
jgi:hypothetical protein